MDRFDWKSASELIATTALVVSILFLAVQTRQAYLIASSDIRFSWEENALAVRSAVTENIDIWVRGLAGERLDASEQIIFDQLITNENDRIFNTIDYFNDMGIDAESSFIAEFAGFLLDNPGAYASWKTRERRLQSYRAALDPENTDSSNWVTLIESAMEKIRRGRHGDSSHG